MPDAELTPKSIRADVKARLAAAGVMVADRIFGFRTTPLPQNKLPALLIYTNGEDLRSISIGAPRFRVSLELAIEAVCDGATDDGLGDALDDLCAAIKDKLLTDPNWIRQFERISGVRTDISADVAGDRRLAAAKLVFTLEFVASYPPNLDTAANLSTVQLAVDTIAPDGDPEVTATITLPE